MEKKIFLIDAMSMIYRAYFALNKNPIINSKGLNTSAILGFLNTITEILKNEKPTHIGVAFDSAAPTFRHEEFTEYKAQREAMPEEISLALPYIHEILEKLEIPIFMIDGFEADDIIGTLAKKSEKEGFQVYMMTSDKDFGQLVSENVFIYKPSKQGNPAEKDGVNEVCTKYEIEKPEQLIDILGLWGDSSDNIPGIPGIGEVKAKKLIKQFGSIENIIQKNNEIENKKIRDLVIEYSEQAIFSKRLATIETEVPLKLKLDKLKWELPDPTAILELFKELEFRTFSKRFFDTFYSDRPTNKIPQYGLQSSLFEENSNKDLSTKLYKMHNKFDESKVKYIKIENIDDFGILIDNLMKCKSFAFDTETTGLDPVEDDIIGISFCFQENQAYYLPITDEYFNMQEVNTFLQQVFEKENCIKIAHNFKFDYRMLKKYGIKIEGKIFDTMIAHYLINPEEKHNLDYISETMLEYKMISFEDILPMKNPGADEIKRVPIEIMKNYSCEDAEITYKLYLILKDQLVENEMIDLFENIEMPLVKVLTSMEDEGISINIKEIQLFSGKLNKQIEEIQSKIYELATIKFNLSSPKQLGEVLFEKLKITEKPPKTKTKQYATGEDILRKFKNNHPIIPLILEHRTLTKLKTTYVDSLPKYLNSKTNRIHTIFNQTVTATGRLSSSNPNIQNIPIRTELGQEIRKFFVPKNENYLILSADYSQIELRIIAALSNEESMINDFKNGLDIHSATASKIYDIPIDEVTPVHRRKAKTVNFGIIYGISSYGLTERLDISRKEADELIKEYFKKYPNIKTYMNETIQMAKEKGYVSTIKNRKRYFSNLNSSNAFVRGIAERMAINMPIQGSAADIIKIAMIKIYNRFKETKLKSRMLLQVHDELVFDVLKNELDEVKNIVQKEMKEAFDLSVPIEIEINEGENWLEAH
jgi:DNA polymerase-1